MLFFSLVYIRIAYMPSLYVPCRLGFHGGDPVDQLVPAPNLDMAPV